MQMKQFIKQVRLVSLYYIILIRRSVSAHDDYIYGVTASLIVAFEQHQNLVHWKFGLFMRFC